METGITDTQTEEFQLQEDATILDMINDYYSRMDG